MEWFSLPLFYALLSLLLTCVCADPQVPCYFIFGDTFSDDGNNNNRLTLEKANYLPYGIDYPEGPTGRFSNGKNLQDVIAELLGFPNSIPPFATATGNITLKGVNYASGGAGILNETGQILGSVIPLDMQLKNHETTISRIVKILGSNETASDLLRKCLYTLAIGTNDYIANYFLPEFYQTSRLYTPQQYARFLIQQYSQQILTLCSLGAKKIALFGLPELGCTPFERARYGQEHGTSCVDKVNSANQLFNDGLLSLVKELNNNISDANFTYINPFRFSTQGLITNSSCCQTLLQLLCIPYSVPCSNRSNYVYWDGVHFTQAGYVLAGKLAYATTSPSSAYPLNLSALATQMDKS